MRYLGCEINATGERLLKVGLLPPALLPLGFCHMRTHSPMYHCGVRFTRPAGVLNMDFRTIASKLQFSNVQPVAFCCSSTNRLRQ
jgi:hypothetical protein